MAKFCTNCGKEVNENAVICVGCGCSLQKESNNIGNGPVNTVDKNASTGLILGLISIIAWFLPIFGYPVTICGIVFSSKGLKSDTKKGLAVAGLILSIIFLIITLINSIAGVIMQLENIY